MPTRRPPQPLPPWARKFRAPVELHGFGNDPRQHNRQSVVIGVIATMVVHLLFVFLPSSLYRVETSVPPPKSEAVDFELNEDDFAIPDETAKEPEQVYVQTNPNAPENEPDATNNVSDRSQQAANEEMPDTLSPDESPAREGEDLESNSIITGAITELPTPQPPPADASEPSPPIEAIIPQAQDPLPGPIDDRGDDAEGVGTTKSTPSENPSSADEQRPGEKDGVAAEFRPPVAASPGSSPRPTPAPRPRVNQVPSTVVQEQDAGVSRLGQIAANAQFGKFGEYQARMIEVISVRWNSLLSSRAYRESGTYVTVGFTITADGDITSIDTLRTTAQQLGVLLSRSAIEQGAPYGRWSEDMVKSFGTEKYFVVTFYYR